MEDYLFKISLHYNMDEHEIDVYIIRHGRTEKNYRKEMDQSSTEKNSKLDHVGKVQSINVGQYFHFTKDIGKLVAVYVSPRLRTFQTADLIITYAGKGIDIETDQRLVKNERSLETIQSNMVELFSEIYNKYKRVGGCVLLVTHNHVIDALYRMKNDINPDEDIKVDNCSISCVRLKDNALHPVFWNKKVHLNFDLV